MKIFAGSLALIGFLLSLAVHVAALSGIDASIYFPATWISPPWLLHLGIFVVMIPLVTSGSAYNEKLTMKELRKILPPWAFILITVISVYVIINFLLFFITGDGQSAYISDGNYVLKGPGHPLLVISASEYHHYQAIELRVFSGHWLVGYLFAALYYFFGFPQADTNVLPPEL